MKPQKYVLKETAHIAIGVFSMVALMLGIYAAIGKFSVAVFMGGIYTGIIATANFFLLGLTVQKIADDAARKKPDEGEIQEVTKNMKAKMQLSYNGRMIIMFALVVAGVAILNFEPLATFLPLVFPRITIGIMSFLNRAKNKEVENK